MRFWRFQKTKELKIFLFTGLSVSGKNTITNAFEQALHVMGKPTYNLDGDNLRHDLNHDL